MVAVAVSAPFECKGGGTHGESWYLSPQWVQSSKVSRGLLRCGPGIGFPYPSDVDPVTEEVEDHDDLDEAGGA